MATIQIVIDDALLRRLDSELDGKAKKRSAFVRAAIERELARSETQRREDQHRAAYLVLPETSEERDDLTRLPLVQDWGESWEERPGAPR